MDDLISRKWLMECVDEGWIKFDTEKDKNIYIHLVRDIAPSAQPNHNAEVSKMEIIRCKDCKRQNTNNDFRSMWCREMLTFVKPDEFCSRAKRRGEAE